MPNFVDTAVKEIEDRIRALEDEAARLEAARAILADGTSPHDGVRRSGSHRTVRPAARRNGHAAAPRTRRGGNSRANQALELVRNQPGITIPEIAKAMKIQPNYLYRVLPRLASEGEIKRDGQGWHPATASTSASSTAKPRRRAQAVKSETTATPTRTSRRRGARAQTATNGGTARGGTTVSVLAALAGGEAMTAGQVATKTGLGRPSVSTTLSKLAKAGQVQKADRGYRLGSGA